MSAVSARVSKRARPKADAAHAVPPRVERIALPYRAAMASRYGSKVAHLPVYSGPAVEMSLKRRGAEGAAVDGAIFLPSATVASDLVAHEVVHALQQPLATGDGEAFLHRLETAPAAAPKGAVENEAGVLARPEGVPGGPAPIHALPAGVVALRRSQSVALASEVPVPSPAPVTPEQAAQAAAPGTAAPEQAPAAASEGKDDAGVAPTFSPPAMPEISFDPAEDASREAAGAEAALASADSPSAVMDDYARMAPSVKALHSNELGSRLSDANANATSELANGTPKVSARLSGATGDLPAPARIVVPDEEGAAASAAAAAHAIDVPAGPEQPQLRTDPAYGAAIERIFSVGADPERIGEQIDQVSTANPGIQTSVTDRSNLLLEGANDLARMDEDARARCAEAAAERQAAAGAVVTGPGPETIVPREMECTVAIEVPTPETAPLAQPEGAAQFNAMTLPGEVVARFDEEMGPTMATSADAARDQMQAAESERDTAYADAVQSAETDRAAAEQQADASQRAEIGSRRESIQAERQRTVDTQQVAVQQVNAEAETARAEHRADADERAWTDRARIDSTYDRAERDSRAEVAGGELRAENERQRAERDAHDQGWWDRAASFIRRAFELLTSAINAIFDSVRSAVCAIIDAAVSAVTAIIEAAAAALQALVSALGKLLKGLIDGLLGQIFPELAAELTQFIDEAVAAVNKAIDAIADTLAAAVHAIGAALNAAINALLDLFQNAMNTALAALQAVMTSDWGALLLKVLDAILRTLGIDPAAFHALIARASDAVEAIVNDPGRFVQNLLDAVVGGVQQFADQFGAHLRDGIIGWLTGALGGIRMPAQWDLGGVLDIARQILGLTWDFVRERAARIVGQENVARLEAAFDWIATLVTEGWSALWNRLIGELQSLKDKVMEAIRNLVLERVVMASVRWLASLFSPVGAIVQLVMTIWNIYQFISNQLQRLFGIAQTVVQGISNIARGVLGPAMNRVEQVLADLLPVVIDLLMSLLGVTGVAARVRAIIGDVRAAIVRAVDNLIDRVLGRRRGRGAQAGHAGEDGAARGRQLGQEMRVDVREGEDHTLSIHRTGEGGATVMLRTDPLPLDTWLARLDERADRMRDEVRKSRAKDLVRQARSVLGTLDDAADRASAIAPSARAEAGRVQAHAEAQLTPLERQIVPILQDLFDVLGSSEFTTLYQTDLGRLHEKARNTVLHELRDNSVRYVRYTTWAQIVAELTGHHHLFLDPLQNGNPFGQEARGWLQEAMTHEKITETAASERYLRIMAEGVRANRGTFTQLKSALQRAIVTNERVLVPELTMAVRAAVVAGSQSASDQPDPALAAALPSSASIIPFLTGIAINSVHSGITEQRLEQLWDASRDPPEPTVRANLDLIDRRFRGAFSGQHEWIPTNMVREVVRRALLATRAGQEEAEAAALWIKLQDVWRTPTGEVIFKPQGSQARSFAVTIASPSGPVRKRATVLQGHTNAVYAAANTEGPVPGQAVGQWTGQQEWHEELRQTFRVGAAGADSRAAIKSIISQVRSFVDETVWTGETTPALEAFDEYFVQFPGTSSYYTGRSTVSNLSRMTARGAVSIQHIDADFRRALGVLGS